MSFAVADEPTPLPSTEDWLATLAGDAGWSRALLLFPHCVRQRFYIANPVSRLLAPRRGMVVMVHRSTKGELVALDVYDRSEVPSVAAVSLKAAAAAAIAGADDNTTIVSGTASDKTVLVHVTLRHHASADRIVPLTLQYLFNPNTPFAPIAEVVGRERALLDFYKELWQCGGAGGGVSEGDAGVVVKVTRGAVVAFSRAIDQVVEPQALLPAPMDYAICVAWTALTRALTDVLDGADPLRLVHLDNAFKSSSGTVLREGDLVRTSARVTQVVNAPSGKRIQVEAKQQSLRNHLQVKN